MQQSPEALKTSRTVSEQVSARIAIAMIKSLEGFHQSSLKDLQAVLPLIRYVNPSLFFNFHNSYATELAEAGRKEEARNISNIVLASPFAYAYPEWQDTANDLRGSQRSFVAFNVARYIPRKVLPMPVVEHAESATKPDEPARVFELEKWIKKMAKGKKKNGNKQKPIEEMNERDMFFDIMTLYTNDDTTDEQRRKIYSAVRKIMSEPDMPAPEPYEPKPDEPDGA